MGALYKEVTEPDIGEWRAVVRLEAYSVVQAEEVTWLKA